MVRMIFSFNLYIMSPLVILVIYFETELGNLVDGKTTRR